MGEEPAYLAPRFRIHFPHFTHGGRLSKYATVGKDNSKRLVVMSEGSVMVVGRVAVEIQGTCGPKWERVARVQLSLNPQHTTTYRDGRHSGNAARITSSCLWP